MVSGGLDKRRGPFGEQWEGQKLLCCEESSFGAVEKPLCSSTFRKHQIIYGSNSSSTRPWFNLQKCPPTSPLPILSYWSAFQSLAEVPPPQRSSLCLPFPLCDSGSIDNLAHPANVFFYSSKYPLSTVPFFTNRFMLFLFICYIEPP